MKKDGAVTFSVQGLEGVPGVTWKSSKPKRVAIDAVTGEATLKKTGSALITATLPGGGELTLKVKVNKGDFARPESIRLQTKAEGQWTDAPAQGITVVPNERGVKNVPTRLVGGGGKIVIESIQIDTDIATRDGGNPAPVKVKKRFPHRRQDHHPSDPGQWPGIYLAHRRQFLGEGPVPRRNDGPGSRDSPIGRGLTPPGESRAPAMAGARRFFWVKGRSALGQGHEPAAGQQFASTR